MGMHKQSLLFPKNFFPPHKLIESTKEMVSPHLQSLLKNFPDYIIFTKNNRLKQHPFNIFTASKRWNICFVFAIYVFDRHSEAQFQSESTVLIILSSFLWKASLYFSTTP
jgi:hypothetical protein